jgi:hypothetical protein
MFMFAMLLLHRLLDFSAFQAQYLAIFIVLVYYHYRVIVLICIFKQFESLLSYP